MGTSFLKIATEGLNTIMRRLVAAMLGCSVCLSFSPQVSAEEAGKPNFVVIMVDDMGHAGVSCFGNPYFTTPEIDRLAAEGMRLTDFHSSGTVCSPTRAGLMTGRYQQRAGIEAVIHPVANHAEHLIAFAEKQFRQVRSVLPGDPCDQGAFSGKIKQ